MKLRNRVLSLLLAVILVISNVPVSFADDTMELLIPDYVLDFMTDVEYGWNGTSYAFPAEALPDVAEGDDVTLVATTQIVVEEGQEEPSLAAGETVTVEILEFTLDGNDAAKYVLVDYFPLLPLSKQITITSKNIEIKPAMTSILYGQSLPENHQIPLADYSEGVVTGDDLTISGAFEIQDVGEGAVGTYALELADELVIEGESAVNYNVTVAEAKFKIKKYKPEAEAVYPDGFDGDYDGIKEITLVAPEGFLIGLTDSADAQVWGDSVDILIQEIQNGSYTYYLRNNDPTSDEYLAIGAKTVNYSSIQQLPEISMFVITAAESDKTLNFNTDGVFTNSDLNITVRAVGSEYAQEMTIYLYGPDGEVVVLPAEQLDQNSNSGRFVYQATATISVAAGQSKSWNVTAYAETSSGKSSVFPEAGSENTFRRVNSAGNRKNTVTPVTCPVTIDKAVPVVEFIAIQGDYFDATIDNKNPNSIRGIFKVDDVGSGVAKVEYLWDKHYYEWGYKDGQWKRIKVKEYREFTWDPDRTEQEIILPYYLSATVKDNIHTLKIRITDKAGNVHTYSEKGNQTGDATAPFIRQIEIKKVSSEGVETDFSVMADGVFHNEKIKIIIYAEEVRGSNDSFISGLNYAKISEGPAWDEEESSRDDESVGVMATLDPELGAYVLVLEPQVKYEDLYITVVDKALNAKKCSLSDLVVNLDSNVLILEDTKPTIDFGDTLDGIHRDPAGKYWFGSADENRKLQINVTDKVSGAISSGLQSQTVLDNQKPIETYEIGSMSNGIHVIEVSATDKAGNQNNNTLVFGKDSTPPFIMDITTTGEDSVTIDETQWFLTDDVTVRVDAWDMHSGLASIKVTVNGNEKEFTGGQLMTAGQNRYVLVNLGELGGHDANEYVITAVASDYAGNTGLTYKKTVYVDRESPKVDAVTAEKAGTLTDQALNFLDFGLYSNDAIVFKVYASDTDGDSGLAEVTVSYGNEVISLPGENGCYYWKCEKEDPAFSQTLVFTVYDKTGRSSTAVCGITSADAEAQLNTTSTFVMIENAAPNVTLDMPDTDVVDERAEEIWYRDTEGKIFTLTAQDIHSGIRSILVTVNGQTVAVDMDQVALPTAAVTEQASGRNTQAQIYRFQCATLIELAGVAEDGKYVIEVIAEDNAGNRRQVSETFYMDLTDPEITRIEFKPATADNITGTEEFVTEIEIEPDDPDEEVVVEVVEYGYFFDGNFDIKVMVSDAKPSSGLYKVNYRLVPYENGEKAEEKIITGFVEIEIDEPDQASAADCITGTATIPVENGFMGKIYLEVVDNVERTSGEKTTKGYVVDDTVPSVSIQKNVQTDMRDAHGNPLYVQANSITVTISDPVAGLRKISYSKDAELNPYEAVTVSVGLNHRLWEKLDDGWVVTGVNGNLVTQIQKTFVFDTDDNDVQMTFGAVDNSNNLIGDVYSEIFTVDLTAPVIHVVFREDDDTDAYYHHNRVADITVIERNFDPALIKVLIENTFGEVPGFTFTSTSATEHIATIDFDEGDYTLEVLGSDLGAHPAEVNYSGGNEQLFYVDKTLPQVQHNFDEFRNDAENSFNVDKTATIVITEHNFDPNQTNLVIRRKGAGAEHTSAGLVDVTNQILDGATWTSRGDVHTIEFCFDEDAVYYIEIAPIDLASNQAQKEATQIFEIDKTAPVVSHKNGNQVWKEDVEFLDIYRYARKDAPAPTVTFQDLNISYIKYTLTTYIPEYVTAEIVTIDPEITEGVVQGNRFELPNFTEDGVYAVKLVAVDVAGNESLLNINTYSRMVNQDVLAFILDSDIEAGTGLYSLEYENGEPISKKPSDFEELKIFVMATKDIPVDIVLRGTDGDETVVSTSCVLDGNIYGIDVMTYTIDPDFFKESFREDTDKELHLTVRTEKKRIDLAGIHIDNIAPTCTFPEELQSWRWFAGTADRTFVITDISEHLVEEDCKVFDNGQEIPFVYSPEEGTLTFTLHEGWHNIGAILSDAAGNECIIQERNNVHIGYFWITLVAVLGFAVISGIVGVIVYRYKRKQRELRES